MKWKQFKNWFFKLFEAKPLPVVKGSSDVKTVIITVETKDNKTFRFSYDGYLVDLHYYPPKVVSAKDMLRAWREAGVSGMLEVGGNQFILIDNVSKITFEYKEKLVDYEYVEVSFR